jgi:NTP pyrophosphatase (non-canonical NTP hydrolase)
VSITDLVVTAENYSQLACRTESPTTPEMKSRFIQSLSLLNELIREQIDLSMRMDHLKKFLFYGKGFYNGSSNFFGSEVNDRVVNDRVIRLLHAAIGISTETGELFEALVDHIFDGLGLDVVNIREEFGDCGWYLGIGCDAAGTDLKATLTTNIMKLYHRYPDKFTEFMAELENRDLIGERTILEQSDDLQDSDEN